MAYTKLTGKDFQKAHLALCEKRKHDTDQNIGKRFVADLVNAALVAVGIIIGAIALGCALGCCVPEGNGWHVGNYADAPAWND
jgi:hypothetical protein